MCPLHGLAPAARLCSVSNIFLSEKAGMSSPPMQHLASVMRQSGLIRFIEHFAELFPTAHLKDLIVDQIGPDRQIVVGGRSVVNFGSDSFLGLDQDARVLEAVRRGLLAWGTHNGAS